jgi:hypothetical protein
MASASPITARFVKSGGIPSGESLPQIGETTFRVISKIKEMYDKPAVVFGRWLGVSDKTAKRKLGHERSITAEELGVLIRSERGFEIVTAIMGDARPEWWRVCSAVMDAADIRKMQIAAQRRIAKTLQGALDADRDLAAAISRAETLAVQDPEHMGNQLDALRSMSRVPHRALASSKGRRA